MVFNPIKNSDLELCGNMGLSEGIIKLNEFTGPSIIANNDFEKEIVAQ